MLECRYYEKFDSLKVLCVLCPRKCLIKNSYRGYCRSRYNHEGVLYTENEFISSLAIDPIEKKPLFHFFPGSKILSAGASGCNFHCDFCQNWQISQCENKNLIKLSPEDLAEKALDLVSSGNIGVAYTYSEPVIMIEYVLEAAKIIREKGLKNVFVSNGYIEENPLLDLLEYIDAFNIDVKAFSEGSYLKNFSADFNVIKKNLKLINSKVRHLEISCLIVPGINDKIEEGEKFFEWLSEIDQNIPVHINRYYPCYKANEQATSMKNLVAIKDVAEKYMKFVYVGNI
jgi:pyruvate formate lyase activating enzyme